MHSIRRIINLCENLHKLEEMLLFELFNLEGFIAKVKSVQELINRGATPGERAAATLAMERLLARAKQELIGFPAHERTQAERRIEAARLSAGNSTNARTGASSGGGWKAKPKPPPPPPQPPPIKPFDVGMWIWVGSNRAGKIVKRFQTRVFQTMALRAEAELRGKMGGVGRNDQKAFQYIASMLETGDTAGVRNELYQLDTAARDNVLKFIHPSKWTELGYPPTRMQQSIDEFERRFGGPYAYDIQFSDGIKRINHDARYRRATQDEIDAAQASKSSSSSSPGSTGSAGSTSGSSSTGSTGTSTGDWRIVQLAHYRQGTSDKIYGIAQKGVRVITFWGGFTKTYLATKDFNSLAAAQAVFRTKVAKGYRMVDERDSDYAYLRRSLRSIP